MAMDKQKLLVNLLFRKTTVGQLEWREAVKGEAFQVSLADKVLRIRQVPSQDPEEDAPDYWIELINSDGKVVDEFNDGMLGQAGDEGTGVWWRKMRELYDMARRTALGSEKILNEIISELGGNDEVPF